MEQSARHPDTVDIICSVLDGAAYVEEFIRSLQAQTHAYWRLWVRDDGSSDATVDIVTALARDDERIRLLHVGGPRLGIAGGFGWLLERVPHDSAYVMCGDADDVWLPAKIASTLAAMREAEARASGPVLVHTDLRVVDAALRVIAPSYWRFAGITPEPRSLRRLIVQNVVTAPTMMLNRALIEKVGTTPTDAAFQDWWYACVAVAFGRVIALSEATILYRQHAANAVGARDRSRGTWSNLPREAARAAGHTSRLREDLAGTARQAAAFLQRYGSELPESDRRFLRAFSQIPGRGFARRKLDVLRLRLLREHGLWRNLGFLLRA